MSGYPLKSVLDLRRREDDAAALQLTNAARLRAEVEVQAARRDADVTGATERLQAAAAHDAATAPEQGHDPALALPRITGRDAAAQAHFVLRLRADLARAQSVRAEFRSGPLREAREAEIGARGQAVAARLGREAFVKHEARFRESARRAADRRDEDALEDVARALRHQRDVRDS